MIKRLTGLVFFLLISPSFSETVLKPERLDIYANRAFITFSFDADKNKIYTFQIPKSVGLENLSVSTDKEDCFVSYLEEIPSENKKLKELENRLKTVEKKIKILEDLKPVDRKIKDFLSVFETTYFSSLLERDKIAYGISKIRKTENKDINLRLTCKNSRKTKIFLQYPISIKANHFYKIEGFTDSKTVRISSILNIKNRSGYSIKDINLYFHTYRKTISIEPPPFEHSYRVEPLMAIKKPILKERRSYVETETKAYFFVENVNIPEKGEKSVLISEDKYRADFDIFIDGYATTTPFLRGVFVADKFFSPSQAKFYIDGIFLGKSWIKPVEKDKKSFIFFGEDLFLQTSKTKVKDFYEKTFLGKSIHTVEWLYRIHNKHRKSIKVHIVDRVPVSTSEDIKIEPFSSLKWKEIKGEKVIWEVILSPDEVLSFKFGYKEIKK